MKTSIQAKQKKLDEFNRLISSKAVLRGLDNPYDRLPKALGIKYSTWCAKKKAGTYTMDELMRIFDLLNFSEEEIYKIMKGTNK